MFNSKRLVILVASFCLSLQTLSVGFQDVTESSSSQRYQKYLASIMEIADANKDGKIDREEAAKNYHIVAQNSDINGDGVITGPELLDSVTGKKSSRPDPGKTNGDSERPIRLAPSKRLAVTVLKLPDSYAKSNIISIDDVLRKLSVDTKREQLKKDIEDIPLLDQFEIQLVDGRQTKMGLHAKTRYTGKVMRTGRTTSTSSSLNIGTSLTVRPKFSDDKSFYLYVKIEGDYLVKSGTRVKDDDQDSGSELEPMFINVDTELQFDAKKPVSALNMLVGGHHVLVLFKIVDM